LPKAKERWERVRREAEAAKRETEEAREAREAEERARIAREGWEKARRETEAEEAKKAEEAKEKAKKAKEAWEKERKEALETREVKEPKKRKEALESREVKEPKKRTAHDIGSDIYEGNVQLVVPSPLDSKQLRQFEKRLERVENLKIVWVGGSTEEDTEIPVIIGVLAQKPMTLIRILKEMPTVEKVDKKGDKIVVTLKTPTVT